MFDLFLSQINEIHKTFILLLFKNTAKYKSSKLNIHIRIAKIKLYCKKN